MRMQVVIVVVVCTLGLGMPACGGGSGGGGGPTFSNATLSGLYAKVCLNGSQAAPEVSATFGTLTADGAGTIMSTEVPNVDGTVGAPLMSTEPYVVSADGSISLGGSTGWITADGEIAILASMTSMAVPSICILLRLQGTFSNASLTGNYYMGAMTGLTAGFASYWTQTTNGPVSFDGAGNGTWPTVNVNSGGALSTTGGGGAMYAVNANGSATLNSNFTAASAGGLSSDGALAIFGGSTINAAPSLNVYVKQGAGMGNASLSGTFGVVGFQCNAADSNNFTSFLGTMSADGAGTLGFPELTNNVEGVVAPVVGGNSSYTVTPTGHLTGSGIEGALTADGRAGFFIGGNGAGSPNLLLFFVRR